jgi:hypothetical protein
MLDYMEKYLSKSKLYYTGIGSELLREFLEAPR